MIGPRTIRAKLTLTTVFVMGAALSVLGVVVYVTASRSLLVGIDQDLLRRGNDQEQSYSRAVARWNAGDRSRPFRSTASDPLRTLRPRYFQVHGKIALPDPNPVPYSSSALADGKLGKASFRTVLVQGQPVRIHTRPILDSGRVAMVTQIPFGLRDIYRSLDNLKRILLILIPFGAVLTGLASLFLINRLMRPLRVITENTEKIGANTYDERIPVVGRDEFANLGSTLNGMLDRLQRGFEIEQETSRRLEANLRQQQRFTADASHELKTPLAVIKTNVSLVRMEGATPSQAEELDAIDEAASRMNRLVQGLLLLARAESGNNQTVKEPCLLAEVARRAVRHTTAENRVKVVVENESATTMGVFDDLVRMVQNLVDNAIQHSGGDLIQVRVNAEQDWLEIEVKDNGKGIDSKHLPHLFDRFYRVDESRAAETGGTGLGLAIAKGIAESHGGSLEVRSELGKGAIFMARLPLEQLAPVQSVLVPDTYQDDHVRDKPDHVEDGRIFQPLLGKGEDDPLDAQNPKRDSEVDEKPVLGALPKAQEEKAGD